MIVDQQLAIVHLHKCKLNLLEKFHLLTSLGSLNPNWQFNISKIFNHKMVLNYMWQPMISLYCAKCQHLISPKSLFLFCKFNLKHTTIKMWWNVVSCYHATCLCVTWYKDETFACCECICSCHVVTSDRLKIYLLHI